MTAFINTASIDGNLFANAELRYTSGKNIPVTTFRLAHDRSNHPDSKPDQYKVVIWGNRGEALHQKDLLQKGTYVVVHGELRQKRWQVTQGENAGEWRTDVEIHINGGGGISIPNPLKVQDLEEVEAAVEAEAEDAEVLF